MIQAPRIASAAKLINSSGHTAVQTSADDDTHTIILAPRAPSSTDVIRKASDSRILG
jgi:hypothetical protein